MKTRKLDEIGFLTMKDERARHADETTPIIRCDIVLTDLCTFKCPYCQGIREDCRGSISMDHAKRIIDLCSENSGIRELRLTGGEPTVWKGLPELIRYAKSKGAQSIGISTNGYSDMSIYDELIDAGVDEFIISLDACDAEEGDRMSGGIKGSWKKVTDNIRQLSKKAIVVLGIVSTAETADHLSDTVDFALSLGAHDVKLISASQYNQLLTSAGEISSTIREKHPLLNYRITNMLNGRNIRGLLENDSHRCPLVLDDCSFAGEFHFPCTLYMRERGNPIGRPSENLRQERYEWYRQHDTHKDPICSAYCIDTFADYNNRYLYYRLKDQNAVPVLAPSLFAAEQYNPSGIYLLDCEEMTYDNAAEYADRFLNHPDYHLLGICLTDDMPEELLMQPKCAALLYEKENGEQFWFTVKSSELGEMIL